MDNRREMMDDYNIDDLFSSVNDIYTQWDEGEIPYDNAIKLLNNCCRAFLEFNQEMDDE
jgi:hypothetical protein